MTHDRDLEFYNAIMIILMRDSCEVLETDIMRMVGLLESKAERLVTCDLALEILRKLDVKPSATNDLPTPLTDEELSKQLEAAVRKAVTGRTALSEAASNVAGILCRGPDTLFNATILVWLYRKLFFKKEAAQAAETQPSAAPAEMSMESTQPALPSVVDQTNDQVLASLPALSTLPLDVVTAEPVPEESMETDAPEQAALPPTAADIIHDQPLLSALPSHPVNFDEEAADPLQGIDSLEIPDSNGNLEDPTNMEVVPIAPMATEQLEAGEEEEVREERRRANEEPLIAELNLIEPVCVDEAAVTAANLANEEQDVMARMELENADDLQEEMDNNVEIVEENSSMTVRDEDALMTVESMRDARSETPKEDGGEEAMHTGEENANMPEEEKENGEAFDFNDFEYEKVILNVEERSMKKICTICNIEVSKETETPQRICSRCDLLSEQDRTSLSNRTSTYIYMATRANRKMAKKRREHLAREEEEEENEKGGAFDISTFDCEKVILDEEERSKKKICSICKIEASKATKTAQRICSRCALLSLKVNRKTAKKRKGTEDDEMQG